MKSQKKSDHFNGNRFFNPTLPPKAGVSLWDLIRLLSGPWKKWPMGLKNATAPSLPRSLASDQVAITFINHASFLIQFQSSNILTDPVWSKRVSPFSWAGPSRSRPPGMEIDELPKIDLILLSHNHYDHLDVETLKKLQKRFAPQICVASGDGKLIRSLGFEKVHELDWWEEAQLSSSLKVTFAPTQHFSARTPFDRQKSLWGSYMIQQGGRSIYFGGDAAYSTHFTATKEKLGPPDIALLGIGGYEPRWFMESMHMNPAEAIRAHRDLGAKVSIGMHFGTFQLSAETIDQPVKDLRVALEENQVPADQFITLQEGETRIL